MSHHNSDLTPTSNNITTKQKEAKSSALAPRPRFSETSHPSRARPISGHAVLETMVLRPTSSPTSTEGYASRANSYSAHGQGSQTTARSHHHAAPANPLTARDHLLSLSRGGVALQLPSLLYGEEMGLTTMQPGSAQPWGLGYAAKCGECEGRIVCLRTRLMPSISGERSTRVSLSAIDARLVCRRRLSIAAFAGFPLRVFPEPRFPRRVILGPDRVPSEGDSWRYVTARLCGSAEHRVISPVKGPNQLGHGG